jgi:hypothetical protein
MNADTSHTTPRALVLKGGGGVAVAIDADGRGVDPSCADVHKQGEGGAVAASAGARSDAGGVDPSCHGAHKRGGLALIADAGAREAGPSRVKRGGGGRGRKNAQLPT